MLGWLAGADVRAGMPRRSLIGIGSHRARHSDAGSCSRVVLPALDLFRLRGHRPAGSACVQRGREFLEKIGIATVVFMGGT